MLIPHRSFFVIIPHPSSFVLAGTPVNTDLLPLVDAFAKLRVLVVGEAMLDSYLEGCVARFCQEAPVPIVTLSGCQALPGGSANTAANVQALGASATLLSVVGVDAKAVRLREALAAVGVASDQLLAHPGRRTLTKQRVRAASQLLLRLDQGSTEPLDSATEETLIRALAEGFPRSDAVVLSDYGYGVLSRAGLRALTELQGRWSKVIVADSRRLPFLRDLGVTAVKPNYEEVAALLGAHARPGTLGAHARPGTPDHSERVGALISQGDRLLDLTGARAAVVTLDREGAVVFERGRPPHRTLSVPVRQACVAGAGDTFSATLSLAIAAGASAIQAAELASAAAAVVVGKERTAVCSGPEVREFLATLGKCVPDLTRLAARVEFYRRQGRTVVFTNGCFDILHKGHVSLLHQAKALGDVLIVGVNSDAGIRRLKGPDRPINTLEDRVQVLAALGCVDHLIPFDEDTPCSLIQALRPHVFVKGGDYTRERLPEAPLVEALGGVVRILPLLEDHSTTGLIEKIQAKAGGMAQERVAQGR
jgi:D-beta-D-heptose 7-phosphate kinase/D-beta-D-heptose 1-phosphate adenosyltransferase